MFLLVLVELVLTGQVSVGRQQEAAGAARWVADDLSRLWSDHLDDGLNQGAWGEVLASAALHVLGVAFEQALVGVAFQVG